MSERFNDWDITSSGMLTSGFPVIDLLEHFASTPPDKLESGAIRFMQIVTSAMLPDLKAGRSVIANKAFHLPGLDLSRKHERWIRNFEIAHEINQLRSAGMLRKAAEIEIAGSFNLAHETVSDIYDSMMDWGKSLPKHGIHNPLKFQKHKGG